MRSNQKETPIKYCKFCGKKQERKRYKNGDLESIFHFNKRPYCDIECMKNSFSKRKGPISNLKIRYSRLIANDLIPKGPCELCGKPGMDVHHLDGNPLNNSLDNLKRLCRSCHIKTHRSKKCGLDFCQRKHKGLGYCEMHLNRFKKYGNPLFSKINGVIIKLNK